jgi:TM2 domain-containing membrane protein YozV
MNCTVHPESAATAYCRTCGKAMCDACKHTVHGVIYCEDCLATRVNQASAAYVPPPDATSPALATLLGFIPGVGAMYNGQFLKGLLHLGIFVGIIGLLNSGLPDGVDAMLGISLGVWVIYMVIDAHKTAKAKQYGLPLPDPFGFERMFGGNTAAAVPVGTVTPPPPGPGAPYQAGGYVPPQAVGVGPYVPAPQECRQSSPVGAIVLIGLGVLFLLNQFGLWHFHWLGRMWPLILIGLGVWLFIRRFGGQASPEQQ